MLCIVCFFFFSSVALLISPTSYHWLYIYMRTMAKYVKQWQAQSVDR